MTLDHVFNIILIGRKTPPLSTSHKGEIRLHSFKSSSCKELVFKFISVRKTNKKPYIILRHFSSRENTENMYSNGVIFRRKTTLCIHTHTFHYLWELPKVTFWKRFWKNEVCLFVSIYFCIYLSLRNIGVCKR